MLEQAPRPEVVVSHLAELRDAIDGRYAESGAERYGITEQAFLALVAAGMARYGAELDVAEKLTIVRSLHVEELVLARACSAGIETAWNEFIARYREGLYQSARRITRDDIAARELADGLYAELYGLPNQKGRRVSKLDYYMGRGSLEGWLRTVLAQGHVDRCRSYSKEVRLGERLELGVAFAAPPSSADAVPDDGVAEAVSRTLAELNGEERFLLASYYLDRNTLAAIGRQLGVHESTVSRKLEKLIATVRKRIGKQLLLSGVDARRFEEILADLDVRDLNVDVAADLRQEKKLETY